MVPECLVVGLVVVGRGNARAAGGQPERGGAGENQPLESASGHLRSPRAFQFPIGRARDVALHSSFHCLHISILHSLVIICFVLQGSIT